GPDEPDEGPGGVTAPAAEAPLQPWERDEQDAAAQRRELREQARAQRQRAHRRRRMTAGGGVVPPGVGGGWAAYALFAAGSGSSKADSATGKTSTTAGATAKPKKHHIPGTPHEPEPKRVRGVHVSVYIASIPSKVDAFLSLAKPGGHGLNT